MRAAAAAGVAAVIALQLSSCITTYRPKPEGLTMTPAEARKVLRKTFIPEVVANGYRSDHDAAKIAISFSKVKVTHRRGNVVEVPLHDLRPYSRFQPNVHGSYWDLYLRVYHPKEGKRTAYITVRGGIPEATAHGFADAFLVLSRDAAERNAALSKSDADLEKEVAAYKAAKTPSDSEEAFRRLKAQAEGALREKDFEEAAEYYDLALKAAPAWAAGRYNFALVLAEIEDYRMAIAEMKKYLLLSPGAPDAEKVRNRIYDWERKLG